MADDPPALSDIEWFDVWRELAPRMTDDEIEAHIVEMHRYAAEMRWRDTLH